MFMALIAFLLVPSTAHAQGTLTNGARHVGEISPAGDVDSWTFSVNTGDSIMLRAGGTNMTPRIRLFGPDNMLVGEVNPNNTTFNRDAVLTYQAVSS